MKCGICGKNVKDIVMHFKREHNLLKGELSEESLKYLRRKK